MNAHRTKKKVVGSITTRKMKEGKLHHRTKLKPYMKEWAVAPETVMSQCGMTLDQRAMMVHRQFPEIHITPQYLGKIFKKHHIKRKKVRVKKFANLKQKERIEEQICICREQLRGAIERKKVIYYIDECMFTS